MGLEEYEDGFMGFVRFDEIDIGLGFGLWLGLGVGLGLYIFLRIDKFLN